MSTSGQELFDLVCAASHPAPCDGGPCATCAFRPGTEANRTYHTTLLAMLCIDAVKPFHCHEHARLCCGWTAAVNMRADLYDISPDDAQLQEAAAFAAELLGDAIAAAVAADRTTASGKK